MSYLSDLPINKLSFQLFQGINYIPIATIQYMNIENILPVIDR